MAAAAPMLIMTALSTGLQMYSGIQQGRMQEAALLRSAQISEANAATASYETAANENIARRQLRQLLSNQLTAQGEAGILGSTFATKSFEQSVASGEADVLNLRYKGLAEVQNYRNEAAMNRYAARDVRNMTNLNTFTTLMGGAASMLGTASSSGMFGAAKSKVGTLTSPTMSNPKLNLSGGYGLLA